MCRQERENVPAPDVGSDKYVAAPTCVGEIDRNLFLRFSHGYSHMLGRPRVGEIDWNISLSSCRISLAPSVGVSSLTGEW